AVPPAPPAPSALADNDVYREARALVEAVLHLHPDVGRALVLAFERGYLDVPFCLHPDNAQRSRSYVDATGRLLWSDVGRMPLRGVAEVRPAGRMTAEEFRLALNHVAHTFDHRAAALPGGGTGNPDGAEPGRHR
ncbi:hypothetical protein ACFQ08_11970, partial [Streptosporangium algeriense]